MSGHAVQLSLKTLPSSMSADAYSRSLNSLARYQHLPSPEKMVLRLKALIGGPTTKTLFAAAMAATNTRASVLHREGRGERASFPAVDQATRTELGRPSSSIRLRA